MSSAPSQHGDKREAIVASVIEMVVRGELKAGQRLVTQELADQFGVSLTPVREALAELAGIGVVDLLPNRGARVHAFSPREIREVCRVRRALECEAVRGAIGRVPPSKLKGLQKELKKLAGSRVKGQRWIRHARELDSQLHDLIQLYCGNNFLRRELARLTRLFRSLRDASWVDAASRDDCDRLAEEAREHLEITRAILQCDAVAAVKAMSQHIRSSARYWTRSSASEEASVERSNSAAVKTRMKKTASQRSSKSKSAKRPNRSLAKQR